MATDDENWDKEDNKNKQYDEISELLKKHYKPQKETNPEEFVKNVTRKIDSLFHGEIISERSLDEDGNVLSDETRYWLGLEEYILNKLPSLKHKTVTDHLLDCKDCRQNYTDFLEKTDKKKVGDQEFLNLVACNNLFNVSFV